MIGAFSLDLVQLDRNQPETALQIYLNRDLTQPYTGQFLWREIQVGENSFTLYLHNRAPFPLRSLSLISPPLPEGCSLSWTCENYTMQPGEIKEATLTLIIGSQVPERLLMGGQFYISYSAEEEILDEV